MPSLGAPTLFPIPPDASFPVSLSRAWLTDVQRTRTGAEVRQAIRAAPVRSLAYTASLFALSEVGSLLTLWLTATEPLRFLVPLWPEWTIASAFPDASTITADTTTREFVAANAALLVRDGVTPELVMLDTVDPAGVTTTDPIVGAWASYPAGSVALIPVIGAWLTPPRRTAITSEAEQVPLEFTEELPGVAGLDSTVGAATTPDGDTLTVTRDLAGNAGAGTKFNTWTARVVDAAGQVIPSPVLTWNITATGDVALTDPGVRVTYPQRGRQLHIEFTGTSSSTFSVTVSYGAASVTFGFSGVG